MKAIRLVALVILMLLVLELSLMAQTQGRITGQSHRFQRSGHRWGQGNHRESRNTGETSS